MNETPATLPDPEAAHPPIYARFMDRQGNFGWTHLLRPDRQRTLCGIVMAYRPNAVLIHDSALTCTRCMESRDRAARKATPAPQAGATTGEGR